MLKQFGLGRNNSNYYKERATYEGAIFSQVPKHRKLYVMNVEPFHLAYGEKGVNKFPGMVKAWNQKKRNYGRRLGLVNKALMNRYIHQRSLEALAKQKYTLANARKLTKVANILNASIQRSRARPERIKTALKNALAYERARKRFNALKVLPSSRQKI